MYMPVASMPNEACILPSSREWWCPSLVICRLSSLNQVKDLTASATAAACITYLFIFWHGVVVVFQSRPSNVPTTKLSLLCADTQTEFFFNEKLSICIRKSKLHLNSNIFRQIFHKKPTRWYPNFGYLDIERRIHGVLKLQHSSNVKKFLTYS